MNKSKRTLWVSLAAVVVLSALVWFGGGWLWHLLLRMHGIH